MVVSGNENFKVMCDKKPFTDAENEVMELLLSAHEKFAAMDRVHPMEMQEWVTSFHHLQDLMIYRVMQRDYPNYFKNINNKIN